MPLASPSFETNAVASIDFKQFYNPKIEIMIPLGNINGWKLCNPKWYVNIVWQLKILD